MPLVIKLLLNLINCYFNLIFQSSGRSSFERQVNEPLQIRYFRSSAIHCITYNRATYELRIQFFAANKQPGSCYSYSFVGENVYQWLVSAPSVGKAYNTFLRDRNGVKVDHMHFSDVLTSTQILIAHHDDVIRSISWNYDGYGSLSIETEVEGSIGYVRANGIFHDDFVEHVMCSCDPLRTLDTLQKNREKQAKKIQLMLSRIA
jgi:hypothetical protein